LRLANLATEEVADDCIRQKYFIVTKTPQYLTIADEKGAVTGAVFVKGPNEEVHIFTVKEPDDLELGLEISVERRKGAEALFEFFVRFTAAARRGGDPENHEISDDEEIKAVLSSLLTE